MLFYTEKNDDNTTTTPETDQEEKNAKALYVSCVNLDATMALSGHFFTSCRKSRSDCDALYPYVEMELRNLPPPNRGGNYPPNSLLKPYLT